MIFCTMTFRITPTSIPDFFMNRLDGFINFGVHPTFFAFFDKNDEKLVWSELARMNRLIFGSGLFMIKILF